jgi:hypothetical protein
MSASATSIPIEHNHAIHVVETRGADNARPQNLTLLELVAAIGDVTDDEREIVATVLYMLRSGSVRLKGNFCGEPIERIASEA